MANILQRLIPANYRRGLIKEQDALIVKAKDINPIIDILNGRAVLTPEQGEIIVDGNISTSGSLSAASIVLSKGTITQGTSITTGVTVNASAGTIVTVSTTIGAGASVGSFTVTNSFVEATSVILTSCLQGASGSSVVANVSNIAAGSFDITLTNGGGATTTSAAVTIQFLVI